jgi:hypothetical protein
MKLCYIAGPYRASTELGIKENIRKAEALGVMVMKAGAGAIIPHKNSEGLGGTYSDDKDKDFEGWMKMDLEIVRRVDCIVALDDWPLSTGATMEIDLCKNKLGKPVFTESTFAEFLNWLIAEQAKK